MSAIAFCNRSSFVKEGLQQALKKVWVYEHKFQLVSYSSKVVLIKVEIVFLYYDGRKTGSFSYSLEFYIAMHDFV